MSIRNSSGPPPAARVHPPVDKGSSTAQRAHAILRNNPTAKTAYIFKGAGFKELSTETPNSLKLRFQGGKERIDARTRKFFAKLGLSNLSHLNPGVRTAAEMLTQAAKSGRGPFQLTRVLRLAVAKLADPADDSFERYLNNPTVVFPGFGEVEIEQVARLASSWNVASHEESVATTSSAVQPVDEADVALPSRPDFAELQGRCDDWRKGVVKTTPEVTNAVATYVSQTYGRENPFNARSPASQPVRDLLTYIANGTKDKLAPDGRSVQPLNQFNGVTFESRAEALLYLLWQTPFMSSVPPSEANRFMKIYAELADFKL